MKYLHLYYNDLFGDKYLFKYDCYSFVYTFWFWNMILLFLGKNMIWHAFNVTTKSTSISM